MEVVFIPHLNDRYWVDAGKRRGRCVLNCVFAEIQGRHETWQRRDSRYFAISKGGKPGKAKGRGLTGMGLRHILRGFLKVGEELRPVRILHVVLREGMGLALIRRSDRLKAIFELHSA